MTTSTGGAPDIDYLPLPDVAEALGIIVTKVHQLLRDHMLLARRIDGIIVVPAAFLAGGEVVRGLPGTITLLADAGYDDDEIIDWLCTAGDGGSALSPIELLRGGGIRQVHRQAQIAGF